MLLQRQTTPYIRVFKLVTGEEIITKVTSEDDKEYTIEKPLQMGMTQRGLQFAPTVIMMDPDKAIQLPKDKVIFQGPPVPELESQYESATTGIALPQKGSIIKA